MTKTLLITDSFFISEPHVSQLEAAGYSVKRLDSPAATEAELIQALDGVSVYIIGGTEQVTNNVINSVSSLEAIIFCGVDYSKFIPGEDAAIRKGIKLLNAPAANAVAVAEFAIGIAISMQRQLFSVSRNGTEKYLTTRTIQDSVIGVIGAGNVGATIIEGLTAFKPKEILYYNRSEKPVAARKCELTELVQSADIVFMALPQSVGTIFDAELINQLKNDALLISVGPRTLIDYDPLLTRLQAGTLRAAIDWPSPSEAFDKLPLETWLSFNSHSAYNTTAAINAVNDSVTATAISLLK